MKDELNATFNDAVKLKEKRDFASARELLLQLHQDDPDSPTILAVLGDVCWELNHLDEAIFFFQKATVLRPSSEPVSLGLFHFLWESNRQDDAFEEMKRFLANNESEEYTRLLADINGS